MAALPRTTIEKGLQTKGFRTNDQKHRLYVLYYGDKKTGIRTKISRSSKKHRDYGEDLLRAMRLQLKLDSKRMLLDLLECPMSYDQYIEILKTKGELK